MAATLYAGSRSESGWADGIGEDARFDYPAGLAADATFLYVTEGGGDRVRRVDPGTAEVSTVAVLPDGAFPYGIVRGPLTGRFYVACPGERTVRVFSPTWAPVATISTAGRLAWFVTPAADEATLYLAGHLDTGNATFDSRVWRITLAGGMVNDLNAPSLTDPGGLAVIAGKLYYSLGRFDEKGIYRAELDLSGTVQVHWPGPSEDCPRQLHPLDADRVTVAFGPSAYAGTRGAAMFHIAAGTLTDPAPGRHTDTGPDASPEECDALFAFGRWWVTSSRVKMTTGFAEFGLYAGGPHSIEIIGSGGWQVETIGFS